MLYTECFKDEELSEMQENCASLCESLISYGCTGEGAFEKPYLRPYEKSLGQEEVKRIYRKLQDFIDGNYVLEIMLDEDDIDDVPDWWLS